MSEKRKALLTPLSVFGKPTELVYQAGKEAERERIIALLAREMDSMRASRSPSDWEQSYGLDIAIALIKGEN